MSGAVNREIEKVESRMWRAKFQSNRQGTPIQPCRTGLFKKLARGYPEPALLGLGCRLHQLWKHAHVDGAQSCFPQLPLQHVVIAKVLVQLSALEKRVANRQHLVCDPNSDQLSHLAPVLQPEVAIPDRALGADILDAESTLDDVLPDWLAAIGRDPADDVAVSGLVDPRDKADVVPQLGRLGEALSITDIGNQGCGSHESDAWNGHPDQELLRALLHDLPDHGHVVLDVHFAVGYLAFQDDCNLIGIAIQQFRDVGKPALIAGKIRLLEKREAILVEDRVQSVDRLGAVLDCSIILVDHRPQLRLFLGGNLQCGPVVTVCIPDIAGELYAVLPVGLAL